VGDDDAYTKREEEIQSTGAIARVVLGSESEAGKGRAHPCVVGEQCLVKENT